MGGVVRPAILDRACGTRRWIRRRPTLGGVAKRIVRRRSASPFRECVTAMPYAVEHDGFAIATGIVPESQRLVPLAALGDPDGAGSRGLLAVPEVRAFARCEAMMSLVAAYLGQDAQPVRAIFFDKSVTSNWLVPWHQDLTIAVASKVEVPGFGPWSVKNGIPHVQPPTALLAQMIAVRLHLDDCDASNGALRVIPGSHEGGRLEPDQISAARAASEEVVCEAACLL